MKKTLIIAAAVLTAMCACTKNEVNEAPQEINFSPATYVSQTKADDDPVKDSHNHLQISGPFGVYAWFNPTTVTATATQNQVYMSNQKVLASGATDGKTYYWPKTGTIDFIGYYPYGTCWFNLLDSGKNPINPTSLATPLIASSDITIAPNHDDLMYSDMALGYGYNVQGKNGSSTTHFTQGVPMLFHHALAKVTVLFKAAKVSVGTTTFDIDVTSAKFTGINKTGSFSANLVNGVVTPNTPAIWNSSDEGSAITIPATADLTKTPKEGLPEQMVLPQSLAGKTIVINFDVTTNYGDGIVITESRTAEVSLDSMVYGTNNTPLANWEMNKRIIYTITIDPADTDEKNMVKFDPAVVDYDIIEVAPTTNVIGE